MFFRNRLKIKNKEIALDEILMDSKNMPGFDTERFEGRLEFPLNMYALRIIAGFFIVVLVSLFIKSFSMQVVQSGQFKKRASNNFLKFIYTPPPRGEIYDRNGNLLVWNEPLQGNFGSSAPRTYVSYDSISSTPLIDIVSEPEDQTLVRKYAQKTGLSLVLGFLGLNSDSFTEKENNSLNFKIGKDGIEKYYNDILKGEPGVKILETDSLGNLVSDHTKEVARNGKRIDMTVDSKVNAKFGEIVKQVVEDRGFKGGAGIIMDVKNGEILAITSFPEYESEVLSSGLDKSLINSYLKDNRNFFLNRAAAGVYAPGSVIKPLIALAALNENIISPNKVLLTHGSISIPNPYSPGNSTVFKDWKNHGEVDMLRALAVSSDVYFYTVGGGYAGIKGLGISKIKQYAEMFNLDKKTGIDILGEKEGVIPSPELKEKTNPENPVWRIGDTYHASIGQGNFQTTPIEMAVYASALANKGVILMPRLIKSVGNQVSDRSENDDFVVKKVDIPEKYFDVIHKGMRMAVTDGTAKGLSGLNVEVAGKTGTAEIGKKYVNAWFIGFWPYENPRYSITIVLERGDPHNLIGGVYVASQMLSWMRWNTPEYLK